MRHTLSGAGESIIGQLQMDTNFDFVPESLLYGTSLRVGERRKHEDEHHTRKAYAVTQELNRLLIRSTSNNMLRSSDTANMQPKVVTGNEHRVPLRGELPSSMQGLARETREFVAASLLAREKAHIVKPIQSNKRLEQEVHKSYKEYTRTVDMHQTYKLGTMSRRQRREEDQRQQADGYVGVRPSSRAARLQLRPSVDGHDQRSQQRMQPQEELPNKQGGRRNSKVKDIENYKRLKVEQMREAYAQGIEKLAAEREREKNERHERFTERKLEWEHRTAVTNAIADAHHKFRSKTISNIKEERKQLKERNHEHNSAALTHVRSTIKQKKSTDLLTAQHSLARRACSRIAESNRGSEQVFKLDRSQAEDVDGLLSSTSTAATEYDEYDDDDVPSPREIFNAQRALPPSSFKVCHSKTRVFGGGYMAAGGPQVSRHKAPVLSGRDGETLSLGVGV